jgi:hypothetical protein
MDGAVQGPQPQGIGSIARGYPEYAGAGQTLFLSMVDHGHAAEAGQATDIGTDPDIVFPIFEDDADEIGWQTIFHAPVFQPGLPRAF